jgi:hypothetical protein
MGRTLPSFGKPKKCEELASFSYQRTTGIFGRNVCLGCESKPELRLIRFLDNNPKLGDEFCPGPGPAILNGATEAENIQRKARCTLFEIVLIHSAGAVARRMPLQALCENAEKS